MKEIENKEKQIDNPTINETPEAARETENKKNQFGSSLDSLSTTGDVKKPVENVTTPENKEDKTDNVKVTEDKGEQKNPEDKKEDMGAKLDRMTTDGTEKDEAYIKAMNNMSDYLNEHNYGREDYPEYSKDPEWQKLNADLQKSLGMEVTTEVPEKEVQKIEDISGWIGEINPNFDPYDWESPYCNNCGSCAWAVEQRLNGNEDAVASSVNIPSVQEMNAVTGMEQKKMTPEEIKEYLISEGPGSHAIVGIDRESGPGHWFNAYYDGEKVVAIDGQTGEIRDWPPDYGNVTNWDVSVRKEEEE